MKRIAIAAALLALTPPALAADGKAIFTARCTSCHAADGKGQNAMGKKFGVKDLTVTKLGEADIEGVVTKGRGKMTPFAGKLSPEEIKAVAAYVKGGLK
jgi:cytochrome c oxidase cbb3-type subunit 3